MTSMRARAIDVAAAAFREAGVRAPRTQASTAVDALLAAGMLTDPEEIARKMDAASSDGFRQGFGGAS